MNTSNEWGNRLTIWWHEGSVPDALYEYARTEGWIGWKKGEFPVRVFKSLKDFISKEISESYRSGFEAGRRDAKNIVISYECHSSHSVGDTCLSDIIKELES